jgi:hypothetical protein
MLTADNWKELEEAYPQDFKPGIRPDRNLVAAVVDLRRQIASQSVVLDVKSFGATGSPDVTTGSIANGSATLTVANSSIFKPGDGIFIAGAGAAGVRLVTTVLSIDGSSIKLATVASTTVSAVAVKHDDTASINAAIAAVYNAGGGVVRIPNGHYRIAGPLNTATNSLLTLPQNIGYPIPPIQLTIEGEAPGSMSSTMLDVEPGGVLLDARDAVASGTQPSVIAGAPYIAAPVFENLDSEWQAVWLKIDKVLILQAENPQLNGIMGRNIMGLEIGDDVRIVTQFSGLLDDLISPDTPEPTHNTVAVTFPANLNNIRVRCGSAWISGYAVGIKSGEHLVLDLPTVIYCKVGLLFNGDAHPVLGSIDIENCQTLIQVTGEVTMTLHLQAEMHDSSEWYATTAGFNDPSHLAKGSLTYSCFNKPANNRVLPITGGRYMALHDLVDGAKVARAFVARRFNNTGFAQIGWTTGGTSQWELSLRPGSENLLLQDVNTLRFEYDSFGNMICRTAGAGIGLTSPNGTLYLMTVNNAGSPVFTPA